MSCSFANPPPQDRRLLRRTTLAARDRLSAETLRYNSAAIHRRLWTIDAFAGARVVLLFVSYRSEVATMPLIRQCLARPAMTVAVPRTLPGVGLEARRLSDPRQDLAPGFCNIPEPRPDRTEIIPPSSIDVVLVPGSVFDPQGGRLGYGGGYYDRFCANDAPQALRVAVGFEIQLTGQVPMEAHDLPFHLLVTEKRIITVAHQSTTP